MTLLLAAGSFLVGFVIGFLLGFGLKASEAFDNGVAAGMDARRERF